MLLGELNLEGNAAVQELQQLGHQFEHLEHQMKSFAGKFAGLAIAYEGIMKLGEAAMRIGEFFKEGFEGVMTLGADLDDLSQGTGETVKDLVILRQAFDLAGLGADKTGELLAKLQDATAGVNEEGKSTAMTFKRLGLASSDLRGKTGIDQLKALQKAFGGIEDQADKVAIARDLFGKAGSKALILLGDPKVFEQAERMAGALGDVLEKNASQFAELDDALASMKMSGKEFFAGALEGLAPTATNLAQALGDIDFVGIGRAVGELSTLFINFGLALEPLAPAINRLSHVLGQMKMETGKWESLGALFGLVGGPLGVIAGGGLGILASKLWGTNAPQAEGKHWSDAFKDIKPAHSLAQTPVSVMQSFGGGGWGGYSGGDPILTESQKQTRLLESINSRLLLRAPIDAHASVKPISAPPVD